MKKPALTIEGLVGYQRHPMPDEEPALAPKTPRVGSRAGKHPIITWVEPEVRDQLKLLGIHRQATIQKLVNEALNDLFMKYNMGRIARES